MSSWRSPGILPAVAIAAALLGCAVARSGDRAGEVPREASATSNEKAAQVDVRLITLNPGHFHAALIQRDQYPNVSPEVHVYAPMGQDLVGHLQRVARFNQRKDNPT